MTSTAAIWKRGGNTSIVTMIESVVRNMACDGEEHAHDRPPLLLSLIGLGSRSAPAGHVYSIDA